jgi:hypothetical protein
MGRTLRVVSLVVAVAAFSTQALAQQGNPGTGSSGVSGIQTVVLKGDPNETGVYTLMLRVPCAGAHDAFCKIATALPRKSRATCLESMNLSNGLSSLWVGHTGICPGLTVGLAQPRYGNKILRI